VTAALRMNDHLMPAAADRFADQAMIVAFAGAGRCVEKIDAEIECRANSGDCFRVVGRPIGARHAITAETDGRYREISITESAALHTLAPSITGIISELPQLKVVQRRRRPYHARSSPDVIEQGRSPMPTFDEAKQILKDTYTKQGFHLLDEHQRELFFAVGGTDRVRLIVPAEEIEEYQGTADELTAT
jgi:hypothetical protein